MALFSSLSLYEEAAAKYGTIVSTIGHYSNSFLVFYDDRIRE